MKDLNIDRGKAIGIIKQVLFDLINFFLGEVASPGSVLPPFTLYGWCFLLTFQSNPSVLTLDKGNGKNAWNVDLSLKAFTRLATRKRKFFNSNEDAFHNDSRVK
jgi:hypothetical protein